MTPKTLWLYFRQFAAARHESIVACILDGIFDCHTTRIELGGILDGCVTIEINHKQLQGHAVGNDR